jgi:hypothetical protein
MIKFVNNIIIGLPTILILINNKGSPNKMSTGNATIILKKLINILLVFKGPSEIVNYLDKHLIPFKLT